MAARAVSLLVTLVAGCAGGPPHRPTPPPSPHPPSTADYPLRVLRVDDAALAQAEQAFRDRTGVPWTEVRIDPFGLQLQGASVVEPVPDAFPAAPTYDDAGIRARWAAFLTEHAAALGLDAPGMVPIPDRPHEVGFDQVWAGQVIGGAQVSWYDVGYADRAWRPAHLVVSGHGWMNLPPEPAVRDPDTLAARWVGRTGTRVARFTHVGMPCDPPGAAAENPCVGRPDPEPQPEARAPHTLTRADVIVNPVSVCRYVPAGATAMELRLVVTGSVRLTPAAMDAPRNGFAASVGFEPDDPLPQRIDAVTGERLDDGACVP